jgi:cytoskeletal protein RodZ
MTNFGATLRQARESKGISLEQLANETRISTRLLKAIENEEFQQLPGGIFNRGFVRAFAERVGLDPEQAVADYERVAQTREPAEVITAMPSSPPARVERHLFLIAVGALLLLIAAYYFFTRDSGNTAEVSNPVPAAAVQPLQPSQSAAPVVPPTTASAASEPVAPAIEPLRIDIEAKEATWIKVTADGTAITAGEILEPGMTRRFTAQNSIDLSVGNAAGVSLKINDIEAKPLGRAGQVREISITPANFKNLTL